MANTSKRGFASMDNEKQRTIASKGGKAAHIKGTAHEWSSEEARAAGRKGGESRGTRNRIASPLAGSEVAGGYSPNFLAEAGSSLRNPNEYGNSNGVRQPNTVQNPYSNGAPLGEHIAPGLRVNAGILADSRVH